jgi:hypothetical protein
MKNLLLIAVICLTFAIPVYHFTIRENKIREQVNLLILQIEDEENSRLFSKP